MRCDFVGELLYVEFTLFFFSSRRRHTRFDCDWSSDVCSSDLVRSASLRVLVGCRWSGYRKRKLARALLIATKLDAYRRRAPSPVAERYFEAARRLDTRPDGGPPEFCLGPGATDRAAQWLAERGLAEARLAAPPPGAPPAPKPLPPPPLGPPPQRPGGPPDPPGLPRGPGDRARGPPPPSPTAH